MGIKTIGIVGSGLMGSGVAYTFILAGIKVILCDISTDNLKKGMEYIKNAIQKNVSKGKLTQGAADQALTNLQASSDISDLSHANAVLEAIIEEMDAKKELIKKLSKICDEKTCFLSNTSGLSVTEMASASDRPEKFIGMHFFNPVPVMKLVEVIRGYETSQELFDDIMELTVKIGKEAIAVNEAPLFAVNRILVPMINEAFFVLEQGIASAEDIDKGMMMGANHPIGPLALADVIGLDTLLMVMESLYNETRDSKYRPATLLVKLVRAGRYGKKNGKGIYDYI